MVSSTDRASSPTRPTIAGTAGLKIPPFSAAMAAIVEPR
jgi:hypothetical protein